ncbi:hypothetical protein [Mucilaginibacter sp. SG564]|uniref:hypothetical protein n=1 Tax=unclassified Mucilaginibacter TaxID=2617802 RepID=UPI0015565015|nr:hypothetical protein [Mucilaginibacter sp. SG564]NOW93359.1 hypothetical protein [Mucilaginibacter sp. SG564]
MNKHRMLWIVVSIFMITIIVRCSAPNDHRNGDSENQEESKNTFPDFGAMIPINQFLKEYPGQKVFKLSQDYPKTLPAEDKIPDFFKIPFDDKARWKEWLMAARDYCFDGMIEANFIAQDNKKRSWYHMPWLHYGPLASEGFNGLAKEAPINPYQLSPQQKHPGQVYALGFYNDFAGHVLYKMWDTANDPDPFVTQGPKGGFPEGTVIFKLLYTDLDSTDVPYLKDSYARTAYITPTFADSVNRVVKKVHLIQMDIMVRDKRAEKYGTGWIFGNFCYNGNLNNGKTMRERVKNLVPVGIQFGNDPQYKTNWINPYPVIKTMINDTLKETFINTSADLPPQHLGWGGRLDGPVDLNTASCMSCHQTAEFPQVAALVPDEAFIGDTLANGAMGHLTQTNDPAWIKYYQNFRCGTAYNPKQALSNDFSLQTSLALGYYWDWKNKNIGGYYANQFSGVEHVVRRGGVPFKRARILKKAGPRQKANVIPETQGNF